MGAVMHAATGRHDPDTPLSVLGMLLRGQPRVGRVVVLSVLSSLTEGLGLLMLVPILASIDRGADRARFPGLSDLPPALLIPLILTLGVLIVVLRALIGFASTVERKRLEHQVVDRLRLRLFRGVGNAEWRWLATQRSADHVAVLSTQLGRIGLGVFSVTQVLGLSISVLVHFVVIVLISWQTALVAVAGGVLVALLLVRQRTHASRLGQAIGPLARSMHRAAQEGMTQVRMNRLLHRQPAALSELEGEVDELRAAQIRHNATLGRIAAMGQVAIALFGVGLVGFGHVVMGLAIASLLPLLFAVMRIGPMVGRVQDGWNNWLQAVPAAQMVLDLIAELDAHAEPAADPSAPAMRLADAILLEGVAVSHPGRARPVLEGVSLRIAARTTTAIVGPSGAGKSTLADLLMGMIEPDKGRILVDGVPIAGPERLRWRRSVAYVDQNAALLNGSIRDNMRAAAPDAGDAEIAAALSAASAGFVAALPAGIDTAVGDNGIQLSGGERQRLALARALLLRPELLILDEATSALDAANQAAIADAIAALHGGVTIVSISHGGWLLDRADRVIRIEDGRIREEKGG